MKFVDLIYSLSLVLSLCLTTELHAQKNCDSQMHLLMSKSALRDIKESDWVVWNPKNSDAEIAHHREESSGTWGYARLKTGTHSLHRHAQEEWYFIRQGVGQIQVGERIFSVKAGDEVFIPSNVKHAIKQDANSQETLIFEYFFPNVTNYEENVYYHWLE